MTDDTAADAPKAARLSETEREVVRRLSSGFGWPTVLLTVALVAFEAGVIALWVAGTLPLVVGFLLNTWAMYAMYTVHHDATHKAISQKNPKLAFWDQLCGTIVGTVMLIEFQSYAKNHLSHHAHTNTPKDPDLFVKGGIGELPKKWLLSTVLMVVGSLPRGADMNRAIMGKLGLPVSARYSDAQRKAIARQRMLNRASLIILIASIPLGVFVPVFFLWWLPARLSILVLMVLFQWLPHFPFDRTDRFGATRITLWPGSTWMLLQQDRHLIHHLYPSIPWYRYRAAYRELLPLLREEGAIIAGPGTEPRTPIQMR